MDYKLHSLQEYRAITRRREKAVTHLRIRNKNASLLIPNYVYRDNHVYNKCIIFWRILVDFDKFEII